MKIFQNWKINFDCLFLLSGYSRKCNKTTIRRFKVAQKEHPNFREN